MGNTLVRLYTLALLVLTAALAQAQTDPAAAMTQANAAYSSGNYADAVKLYQSLVDGGVRHESLFFNLGSAYYQTGDLGSALLNWRRAQTLTPRDGDVSRWLAQARQERIEVQGDESGWLEGMAVLSSGLLTPAEMGWLALGAWSVWFAMFSVYLLRQEWRDGLRAPLIVGGVVTLGLVMLLISRYWVDGVRPAAVMVQPQVSAMSGPGVDYLELFPLHAAAEMRIVEEREEWLRIALPDGRQGWLPADAVERVEP